jgi:hypothetical protein
MESASMRWKIVLEGTDEFGSVHRSELEIDKDMKRLWAGEIGFSVEDGKAINGSSPAGRRQPTMRGLRSNEPLLHGL